MSKPRVKWQTRCRATGAVDNHASWRRAYEAIQSLVSSYVAADGQGELSMPRPHCTAYMPAGATITTRDGSETATRSRAFGDPQPWHTAAARYDDEWAADQVNTGAAVTLSLVPYQAGMLQDVAAGRVREGRAEPHHVVVRRPMPQSVRIHVSELINMGWAEVGDGRDPDWRPVVLTDIGRFVLDAHEAGRAVTWPTCG